MRKMLSRWYRSLQIISLGLRQLKELLGKIDQVMKICYKDKKLERLNKKIMKLVILILSKLKMKKVFTKKVSTKMKNPFKEIFFHHKV